MLGGLASTAGSTARGMVGAGLINLVKTMMSAKRRIILATSVVAFNTDNHDCEVYKLSSQH